MGRSGLSPAEFCRRQKLKAVTFAWWQRRLQERDAAGEGRPARRTGLAGHTRFVEVALPCRSSSATASGAGSLVPPSGGYELVLPGRVCLRLPADFDPERVAWLVQALGTAAGGPACGVGRVAAC